MEISTKLYRESLKGDDPIRGIDIDGRIIFKHVRETGCDNMDTILIAISSTRWMI
jgi:hypothetical protein